MSKKIILLVDDEKDVLELMGARIKSWGYDLVTALNGREAIAIIKNQNPDIVVLDYMLPDMDGVYVLGQIRKIKPGLAVIMFTAYPEVDVIKDAEALGVNAFIPKLSAYVDVQAALKTSLDILEKKLGAKEKS